MPEELLRLAAGAAREAGALLATRFRQPATGVAAKSSATDPVTDADRDAEALLRERIGASRPGDAILGEEGGAVAGESGLRWVIDPLDGTVNFLYGLPTWSVSVACEDETGGVVGVVFDPTADELFAAVRGAGATLNGRPIAASDCGRLDHALIATGFSYRPDERAAQAGTVARILPEVRDIRRAGSAALDLCSVACGRVDGFYEIGIRHWDRAAGMLLVTESGGRSSPLPAIGGSGDGVLAAGAALHDPLRAAVLAALDGSPPENPLH